MCHPEKPFDSTYGVEWSGPVYTPPSLVTKWDLRFAALAETYSQWSKDPSTKIGAIFVNDKNIMLSAGWNGFPRGIRDDAASLDDRETKYKFMVHAEMNAIFNACHSGISLDGSTLYVHGLPICRECAKGVIQVGTRKVVCNWHGPLPDRWKESWQNSQVLLNEAGIETLILNEEFY
jgi:dCMP deaminase